MARQETTYQLLCSLQKLKLLLLNAKDKDKDPKTSSLMAHLRKIDEHLGRKGTRFLTGDTMCCFDCELMPRLQHIRVAGKYFADFEIPETLIHLWRYMHHMYRLDAFLQSCPADQDIINHYKLQQVRCLWSCLRVVVSNWIISASQYVSLIYTHAKLRNRVFFYVYRYNVTNRS